VYTVQTLAEESTSSRLYKLNGNVHRLVTTYSRSLFRDDIIVCPSQRPHCEPHHDVLKPGNRRFAMSILKKTMKSINHKVNGYVHAKN
jgi:hypothetical protein